MFNSAKIWEENNQLSGFFSEFGKKIKEKLKFYFRNPGFCASNICNIYVWIRFCYLAKVLQKVPIKRSKSFENPIKTDNRFLDCNTTYSSTLPITGLTFQWITNNGNLLVSQSYTSTSISLSNIFFIPSRTRKLQF